MITSYNVSLDKFRSNSKYTLQNVKFIRKLRENRQRFIYHPILENDREVYKNV